MPRIGLVKSIRRRRASVAFTPVRVTGRHACSLVSNRETSRDNALSASIGFFRNAGYLKSRRRCIDILSIKIATIFNEILRRRLATRLYIQYLNVILINAKRIVIFLRTSDTSVIRNLSNILWNYSYYRPEAIIYRGKLISLARSSSRVKSRDQNPSLCKCARLYPCRT